MKVIHCHFVGRKTKSIYAFKKLSKIHHLCNMSCCANSSLHAQLHDLQVLDECSRHNNIIVICYANLHAPEMYKFVILEVCKCMLHMLFIANIKYISALNHDHCDGTKYTKMNILLILVCVCVWGGGGGDVNRRPH